MSFYFLLIIYNSAHRTETNAVAALDTFILIDHWQAITLLRDSSYWTHPNCRAGVILRATRFINCHHKLDLFPMTILKLLLITIGPLRATRAEIITTNLLSIEMTIIFNNLIDFAFC